MQKTNLVWAGGIIAVIIVITGLVLFANQQPKENQSVSSGAETVKLMTKQGVGQYMTDDRGMTLYYFPKDNINKSNCFGGCLQAWPVFYSENINVKSPLNQSDFGKIAREGGGSQTAYKGWPLYYYYQDLKSGDTFGEGVGDVWYIVPEPFYTVMLQNKEPFGNYLVDSSGMTLYYFASDIKGTANVQAKSNCSGQCLVNWPAFYSENVIAPSLLSKGDFSSIERADGKKQLTFKGAPLYYYINDKKPGDTFGHEVNNLWFVVRP